MTEQMRIYCLRSSILEHGERFKVRVAATLRCGARAETISQERICDSKVAAAITKDLLIEQVIAAVKAIGGVIDLCATNSGY